jgi:hypothetical protein
VTATVPRHPELQEDRVQGAGTERLDRLGQHRPDRVEGLQALGLNAKTATPEATVWTESLITGDFDVALQGYFAGANPHKYFETAFHSRNMGERGNRFAAPRYKDPELDKLIDDFTQTADAAKQKEIMFAIQERVGANQTIIPVFNNPTWYEYSTKRFNGWFSADNPVAKPQVHPDTRSVCCTCCHSSQTANHPGPLRGPSSRHVFHPPHLPGLGELCPARGRLAVKGITMGFILRRFSFYLVAFLVAATINFLLPRAMPGDPVSVMFARAGAMMEPAALEALKATFGFVDGPIGTQFLTYVKSVFTWDLGTSVRYYPQPVADVLGRAIGWTLFLVGTSTILSFSIGSIVGIFAAWYRGGRMDSILSPLTLVMQAIPPVVVSLLALFLFG